ncbi:hypothetical protein FO519_002163 [Halicephalobus sp. NKZ332]|nr:hypothetical protein FO519_002163 [Halicephalobus sp. NKZ332]
MTCGLAVKRPHDYEAYLADSGVEVKRPRQTNAHCSPFRPQFGTLAASLPTSNTLNLLRDRENDNSPFSTINEKCTLSSSQLDSYLTAEIRYLKRRKLIPRRQLNDSCSMAASSESGSNTGYRNIPGSPNSVHSGSDSDGECTSNQNSNVNIYTKPNFNLQQVKMICERLLKQQEVQLRHEYETVLNKKLEEQHDQFVQFTNEQRPSTRDEELSYVN